MNSVAVLLFAALMTTAACSRSDEPQALVCATDAACPSGYHCGPAGVCLGDVPCVSSADCCLAQRCDEGRCRRRQMCSAQAPCGDPADECFKRLCVPRTCASQTDCPAPNRCIVGTCRRTAPCDGQCPPGTSCALLLNRCVATPAAKTCAPGQLAVLDNERDHFDEGCAAYPALVSCRALPPLPETRYGLVAATVLLGADIGVLSYDRNYGDLILAKHDRSPPHERLSYRAIAGVSDDAPVVADPKGPRGGVAAAGPDIGDAIAVAPAAAGAHVAVHDGSTHALIYLALDDKGSVQRQHVIEAGLGRSVAIAVDGAGVPWVAAFADPEGGDSVAGTRAIRLFRAKVAAPKASVDWLAHTLHEHNLAARAASPIGPSVRRGTGVHLSLGVRGATATVAAYEPDPGRLLIFRGAMGAVFTKRSLDPDAPLSAGDGAKHNKVSKHDIGRFAALRLDASGRAHIVCQDSTGGRVLLVREDKPGGNLSVVVADDGLRADGHHRVGADLRSLTMSDDSLLVAYQDSRALQPVVLRIKSNGKAGTPIALKTAAAGGFSTAVVAITDKSVAVGSGSVTFTADAAAHTEYRLYPVVLSAQ